VKKISLSANALKLIACVTMLIDHVGLFFFPADLLWRVVGRIAFPLFALLIAEGFEKTSNVERYLFRLLAFAAISQLPYSLMMLSVGLPTYLPNIFITLAAGLLALILLRNLPARYSYPLVGIMIVCAQYFSFDYGAYGILLILGSALFLKYKHLGALALLILHAGYTVAGFFTDSLSVQTFAAMSVPILMCYNGERGSGLPRHFFYWFYPAHLLVLWMVWFATVI